MKVIFISRKYCRGEAWCNRLLAYAKNFMNLGVEVSLLFLVANEQSEDSVEDFQGLDVKFISRFSDNDRRLKKKIVYTNSILSLSHYISKGDVLFTCDGGGLFLPFLFYKRRRNFTISEITEHPEIMGAYSNLGFIKKQLRSLRLKVDNKLISHNSGILTITKGLQEYYLNNGVSPAKICRVNMFVDASRFNIDKKADEEYIAYCGTISFMKDGVDLLVKAFSIFRQSFPNYKLFLIGPYMNKETARETECLINDLGLKESVVLTGKVSPGQMPSLLKNASILALSRPNNLQNRYGFPTKLGEYLATGNPVVITAIGEIPQYLKDGYNAYFTTPGNVQSFADGLIRACNDNNSKQVGKNGKALALSEFDACVQVKAAFNFIKNLVESK